MEKFALFVVRYWSSAKYVIEVESLRTRENLGDAPSLVKLWFILYTHAKIGDNTPNHILLLILGVLSFPSSIFFLVLLKHFFYVVGIRCILMS